METFLVTQYSSLTVERLPTLESLPNPFEALRGNLRGEELANLCLDNTSDTEYRARRGVRRIKRK